MPRAMKGSNEIKSSTTSATFWRPARTLQNFRVPSTEPHTANPKDRPVEFIADRDDVRLVISTDAGQTGKRL